MKTNFKKIIEVAGISAFSIIGFLLLVTIVSAYSSPTASPPGGNVTPPLNTGGTAQTKSGNLTVNALGITGAGTVLQLPSGSAFIGTSTRRWTIGASDTTIGAWLRNDGLNAVLSTNVGSLFLGFSGNAAKTIHIGNGNPGVVQVAGNAGAGRLVVSSAGNVGIRTAPNAAYGLHVGNVVARFDNNVAVGGTITASGTIMAQGAADICTATRCLNSAGGGTLGGAGSSTRVALWSNSSTLANSFMIQQTTGVNLGNIGLQFSPGANNFLAVYNGYIFAAQGYYQPGIGGERLKMIRGRVFNDALRTIVSGTGFFATSCGNGCTIINFSTNFNGLPTVVATAVQTSAGATASVMPVSNNSVTVYTANAAGVSEDREFNFIAIGVAP